MRAHLRAVQCELVRGQRSEKDREALHDATIYQSLQARFFHDSEKKSSNWQVFWGKSVPVKI
jgi:hypothetical protein